MENFVERFYEISMGGFHRIFPREEHEKKKFNNLARLRNANLHLQANKCNNFCD